MKSDSPSPRPTAEPQQLEVAMEQNYFVNTPWTWRERLRYRLFPTRHCALPSAPAHYRDCLIVKTVGHLDVLDRLRVLLTGNLVVETRTVTEHTVGGAVTSSVVYPVLSVHHD